MTVIAGLPMDESEQDRIARAILDPRKCRPKQRFFRIFTINKIWSLLNYFIMSYFDTRQINSFFFVAQVMTG